jgi:hypothetical protein
MELTVWTVNGIPVRLVWEGRRYRVNDTPTPLDADDIFELTWHPALTHPLPAWRGWRFQAIDDERHALVFDVREGVDGSPWHLLRTYDDTASARRSAGPTG